MIKRSKRQIQHSNQSTYTTKKDKIKTSLALINRLQLQDSACSDEEMYISASSKTVIVCKLARVPPEIWMTLPLVAKKLLFNERKRQQEEEEKRKRHAAQMTNVLQKSLTRIGSTF
jgi:hypothetical protein